MQRNDILLHAMLTLLLLALAGCVAQVPTHAAIERPITVLAPYTVEVPITVITWQTVEVPVTIVVPQTVQVPMTVEVARPVTITVEAPVALPEPTQELSIAPKATETASGPSTAITSYAAIARPQNEALFSCLNSLEMFRNYPARPTDKWLASAVDTLARVGARVSSVRGILDITPPPAELAEAHQLMLKACDHIDHAVRLGWEGRCDTDTLDRAYEANMKAKQLLDAARDGS